MINLFRLDKAEQNPSEFEQTCFVKLTQKQEFKALELCVRVFTNKKL